VMGDMQATPDTAVNSGTALLLLRLQADDFLNGPQAAGQAWVGATTPCCQSPQSPVACAAEAQATCFKGNHVFQVDPSSPQDTLFAGSLGGGSFSMTAPKLRVLFPFSGAGVIDLDLIAVQLKGTFDGLEVKAGVLAGALSKSEVNSKVVPMVATMLSVTLADPSVSAATKAQISALFDADKDGIVSPQEVSQNPLILTFLSGDVDADGDGQLDLSLGIGYSAVPAVIDK